MMPIALLEATASGLPCLVHRHPVMEWIIGPGGQAIDMAADGALAAAMECLLRDPARRRQLGRAARRTALSISAATAWWTRSWSITSSLCGTGR